MKYLLALLLLFLVPFLALSDSGDSKESGPWYEVLEALEGLEDSDELLMPVGTLRTWANDSIRLLTTVQTLEERLLSLETTLRESAAQLQTLSETLGGIHLGIEGGVLYIPGNIPGIYAGVTLDF